jgi:hypothetical protein
MHTTHTTSVFLLSALISLIAIGTFVFFLHVIKHKNEHTSSVISSLEDKQIKKENSFALLQKTDEVEAIHQSINAYLVDPSKIDSFVEYLEGLGVVTGAKVKAQAVEISSAEKNTILIRLSIKGGFDAVMKTVALIENAPYQIHVTELYLNKSIATGVPTPAPSLNGKTPEAPAPSVVWEADLSFNVLTTS